MMPAGAALGYDATPPISAPLRYFLTAPFFGMLAGLLLLISPDVLVSRWTPGALALTHLATLGFMVMVMVGALFQILPVVCGAAIPMAGRIALAVHLLLVGGTVALATGLYKMSPPILTVAAALLGMALSVFLLSAMIGLSKVGSGTGSQRDVRLALIGLGVAALLGLSLALTRAQGLPLPMFSMLQLHLGWALLGGAGLLLAATSWIVVPMFQITPSYPRAMIRFWALSCTGALTLWSISVLLEWKILSLILLGLIVALTALFLFTTLVVIGKTRRSHPDASYRLFRLGIWSLIAGLVCLLSTLVSDAPMLRILAGVLIIYGGFVSVIEAMLYKIVPFLAWLHLTQSGIKAPNVRQLQPEDGTRNQLRIHTVALVILLMAVLLGNDWLTRLAGAAIVIEFGWLFFNMHGVLSAYRKTRTDSPARRYSSAA
ncbi:MAG TPA: hypothetical protein PLN31_12465 [Azoarcus taiwanensis]|uniref:Uncharacterized protein n=1 Tax=Azoarcus taiwanensis TaxID=666964 RepID=A0A972F7F0_9RHOO|nr:hypothetical protein [Azoarcus taiwanensis]NMG03161.1 hypothetical protein [Azoarcus taiwanensis]HRQ58226.1 hypothetical protein [Azoarcus taiwanensis]